jgi:nucleoside-diphosphate-sugar epimerase
MKKIIILGAAGFLGGHLEARLKADGHFVVSAGRSRPKYRESIADEFHVVDLRDEKFTHVLMARYEYAEVYALAGDVGGLGHIATGRHDAEIMTNSTRINLAVLEAARRTNPGKIFFASSQCVYPDPGIDPFAQERIALAPACREQDASFNTFPFAQEKLYAEALYRAHASAYGLEVRIGRLGNTYGPYCTWDGARAKAVASICRKVLQAPYAGTVELWGSGNQTRSFTYVDDVIDGILRLMAADYSGPVNIASSQQVTIIELLETVCRIANKIVGFKTVPGPIGVNHRNSDNTLCRQVLNWEPRTGLELGIAMTYPWIREQVDHAS